MPLGKLSRKHIESGYGVLTEIQEAIKAEPVSEGRLLALSNKFYTIIPHTISSHESAPILRTEDDIKKKLEMIDSLLEIEIATKMLKEGAEGGAANAAAAAQSLSMDPIDVHYRQLKTDMKVSDAHATQRFIFFFLGIGVASSCRTQRSAPPTTTFPAPSVAPAAPVSDAVSSI